MAPPRNRACPVVLVPKMGNPIEAGRVNSRLQQPCAKPIMCGVKKMSTKPVLNTPFANLTLSEAVGLTTLAVEKETIKVSTPKGDRNVTMEKVVIANGPAAVQEILNAINATVKFSATDKSGNVLRRLRNGDIGTEIDQIRSTKDLQDLVTKLGAPLAKSLGKGRVSYSFKLPQGYKGVAYWVPFSRLTNDEQKRVQPTWNVDRKKVDFHAPAIPPKAQEEIRFDLYQGDGCPLRWAVHPRPQSYEDPYVFLGTSADRQKGKK